MNRTLLLTLISIISFSFINATAQNRYRNNLPRCTNNTWTFLYSDIKYVDILRTYETDPTFLVSLNDLYSGKLNAHITNGTSLVLKLDAREVRNLMSGPFRTSEVSESRLSKFVSTLNALKSGRENYLRFIIVPYNTPLQVLVALEAMKIKTFFQPPTPTVNFFTNLTEFPLKDVVQVDLSTNALDCIVNIGRYLDYSEKYLHSVKECFGTVAFRRDPVPTNNATNITSLRAIVREVKDERTVWTIDRNNIIEDSWRHWDVNTKYSFLKMFKIEFVEEGGEDNGGLYKDWNAHLLKTAFGSESKYFQVIPDSDGLVVPKSVLMSAENREQNLKYFEFLGSFVAKGVLNGRVTGVPFPNFLLRMMLNQTPLFHDIANDFPYEFSMLKNIDAVNLDQTNNVFSFVYTRQNEQGIDVEVELKPNGSNIYGTEENKCEYMMLKFNSLVDTPQIHRFVKGFRDLFDSRFRIDVFKPDQLGHVITGPLKIDLKDWKANTIFENYEAESLHVIWFWQMVDSFTEEQRRQLLKFATGSQTAPLEGFSNLRVGSEIRPFKLSRAAADDLQYPCGHTCFNVLDLPQYSSLEVMTEKFLQAIQVESFSFI